MISEKEFEYILYSAAFLVFFCFVALLFTREFKDFSSDLFVKKSADEKILFAEHIVPFAGISIKTDVILDYDAVSLSSILNQHGRMENISNHVYGNMIILSYDDMRDLNFQTELDLNDDLMEIDVADNVAPSRSVSPLRPQMMTYKSFFPCVDFAPA